VAPDHGSVTVDEGSMATMTGVYGDVGVDTVTLTASVGTLVDNLDGTWSWSNPALDGPASYTVMITADDGEAPPVDSFFDVYIDNVPPTVDVAHSLVEVNEPATAFNNGTFADLGDDIVTISASIGTVTQVGTQSGAWDWSFTPVQGDSQTVTITATDSDGDSSFVTFDLVVDSLDFGDAPDGYATLLASDGARHIRVGPQLGNTRDPEVDGQPSADATGDGSDEDGVSVLSPIVANGLASVRVNVQGAAGPVHLDAWVDWNRDGDWADADEYFTSLVTDGDNDFVLPVPASAYTDAVASAFARFRLSTAGGLLPTGLAADGEVEDYQITLLPPPAVVYVDDNFSNPVVGEDPDGVGPATSFGYDAFDTIQQAVDVVTNNGVVQVLPGTYSENVSTGKGLTLAGSGATTLLSPSGGVAINLTGDGTTAFIEDLVVSGADSAIDANGLAELNLSGLTLTGNGSGGTLTDVATINFQTDPGDVDETVEVDATNFGVAGQYVFSYSGATTLNVSTGGGDDSIFVSPAAATTIGIDGGPHFLGDAMTVDVQALPATIMPTQVLLPGRQPVTYVDIEKVHQTELVVDNADPDFHLTGGSWSEPVGDVAYHDTFRYVDDGLGNNVAEWTFALTPGQYRVWVTWVADPVFATNVPFTMLDGSTVRGAVRINQELAPSGPVAYGFAWEDLGTFAIGSGTLRVRTSDDANQYVCADAVRIERIGDLPTLVDNADAGFSVSGAGWSEPVGEDGYEKTFRYAAPGVGNNTAEWAFTVTPGLYRVSATWVADAVFATNAPYTVLDGSTIKGTVLINQELAPVDVTALGRTWETLDEFAIGGSTLRVRLGDNADGYVCADAIRIERIGDYSVVDNADAAFSLTGSGWSGPVGVDAYLGTFRYAAPGVGNNVAEWAFAVTAGQYRVSVTWVNDAVFATNATYKVVDGSTVVGSVQVNQEEAPVDIHFDGANWDSLGVFDITSDILRVRLGDDANGYVCADAVRIEKLN
jgi:hypothetical protein